MDRQVSRAIIDGFDYRIDKPVKLTRSEWRNHLRAIVHAGGFRRVEHGETFGHGKDGRIAFEIYANVSERQSLDND